MIDELLNHVRQYGEAIAMLALSYSHEHALGNEDRLALKAGKHHAEIVRIAHQLDAAAMGNVHASRATRRENTHA